ncbi:hypothetical protein CPC735_003270 [Coccidioides posadasii C735 delta SOWgp]|uniref:SAP domain-containing protein n=1 Tax=Coccidioides posadasii (strain C735) TaxID=222929 RepID=C5P8U6_COCP7|nr:hypothetical protein CPC735_003270 [Coccidioides posadasii C735 delta SOWgp]EER26158.1 hypothetical protein CPC735_003270 [Coccidioides posadasii C735 delta SOWgp]|eukprot:XP_003068303.1 hypothetical protein CPC735_003270 [Coccidioides posadasii C735 delta SOWgp]
MLVPSPAQSSLKWLGSLKATQLQRIAFLTGVSSSGTKLALIERITKALSSPAHALLNTTGRVQNDKRDVHDGRLSILSIDMGIRNLAYAHLLAYPERNKEKDGRSFTSLHSPILDAWNRLVISEFPNHSTSKIDMLAPLPLLSGNHRNSKAECKHRGSSEVRPEVEEVDTISTAEKESFAPDIYASHAYTLITSLIDTFRPTHVLIERQRFRTGGGSAVQEWTIRVGVFEGMLYAVLHTLKRESKNADLNIMVQGVEPQRVARYWIETDPEMEAKVKEKKKKPTSKEGKKAKVDLVGRWISSPTDDGSEKLAKVGIEANSQANRMAEAFLRKWRKGRKGSEVVGASEDALISSTGLKPTKSVKRKRKGDDSNTNPTTATNGQDQVDIGKLDDLADCLLQGVAWLEWQRMRERIIAEGVDGVLSI